MTWQIMAQCDFAQTWHDLPAGAYGGGHLKADGGDSVNICGRLPLL